MCCNTGKYPGNLEELKTYFPERIPPNPYNGESFKYWVENSLPVIEYQISDDYQAYFPESKVNMAYYKINLSEILNREMLMIEKWKDIGFHVATGNPDPICDRISELKEMGIHSWVTTLIEDDIYNAFIHLGERAIPCLIPKIIDTTLMKDPRKDKDVAGFTVGDAACFLLIQIFNDLPRRAESQYYIGDFIPYTAMEHGIDSEQAYFKFVSVAGNRTIVRNKCNALFLKFKAK